MSAIAPSSAQIADLADFRLSILDNLPIGVCIYTIEAPGTYRVAFLNQSGAASAGTTPEAMVGKLFEDTAPADTIAKLRHIYHRAEQGEFIQSEDSYALLDKKEVIWTRNTFRAIRNEQGQSTHIMNTWEDITEQKRREQAEVNRREEIIMHQEAILAELSTPLLTISDSIVVLPLVGAVDSRRIQQVMDAVLTGVSARRAANVILDITGVPVVDTQVADALLRVAQAVTLLGARIVLTGIRPEVAQTLVGLAVDMRTITTRSSLQDGIAYAMRQ